jgi:EAL domain-containing protein (putative c-di-GMP-specific phosphodiesterase class I)
LARLIKNGKIIPPVRFIGILEDAGLIGRLDSYIWELAIQQLQKWQNTEFSDLYISVNISALDFYYIDVYETLTSLMEKYEVPREMLRLEMTAE